MRASSSSKSITDATWRPRSNSVSRMSRSFEPAASVGGALSAECGFMRSGKAERLELYFERHAPAATSAMSLQLPLDYTAIERILPHRYPFLLVDRVTEFEPDQRIVGIKNVSHSERYLWQNGGSGPALPPTVLTEAVAQVGAILILSKPENAGKLIVFRGIERVRFRKPVRPGDVVEIEAIVKRLRGRMGVLRGAARVNGHVVCDGTMTFALEQKSTVMQE